MIRVENLGIRFEDLWIFRDLHLFVPPSGTAAIVGPSGSGKSVLLKIIAGLIPPSEGTASVDTDNVGMLFQKNALFDSLTVIENLLFPLEERFQEKGKGARFKAREFLQAVGLHECEDLYPSEISGGMQKRLGIARALIVEPEVILYDEPTAGLDPITSRMIAQLILQLREKQNTTVLMVTNDMNRAYQMDGKIYLLAKGHLLEGGSPEETKRSKNPEIHQFIYGLTKGPLTEGDSRP